MNSNSKEMKRIIDAFKKPIRLNENLDNDIKLYHRIGNKNGLEVTELTKSIVNNGLVRYDNGEVGNVIWFSNTYDDYAKEAKFVLSINYNQTNKEKYEIYYDNHNGYAYKDIPFYDLDVVKIPTLIFRNKIESSTDCIRLINEGTITSETLNKLSLSNNIIIYKDIFNKYVQPYINIKNFISYLDEDKIKMIDIFN